MKAIRFASVAMLLVVLVQSCKKDNETPPYARLKVSFSNQVDGQPVVLGPYNYTNAANNQYSVDMLKYYVTNFVLVKADGSEQKFNNYALIDASFPASLDFNLDSVINGDYTAVKFFLGVDSAHNHSIDQEGALDPGNGMIWDWNTGYIFFKHEGFFKNTNGEPKSLIYHFGTDQALSTITVPIPKMTIAGATRNLHLKFNLNSAYTTPGNIDFNVDSFHMSSSADDLFWIDLDMKKNFADAFQFDKLD